MKKILLGVSLLCVLSIASSALTYYQLQPQTCLLESYDCNGIPLKVPLDNDAAYSFSGGATGIAVGGSFAVVVNDKTGESGKITHILQQAPPLHAGNSGPFGFGFSLSNGHTGTVTGKIKVTQVCHRYCWPYAIVESSTVVVN